MRNGDSSYGVDVDDGHGDYDGDSAATADADNNSATTDIAPGHGDVLYVRDGDDC